MVLDNYIANLLYDHNCVIVPSFGAFIANFVSAELDEQKQIISPPTKQIAFNSSLVSNDALLSHHVANIEGISFDQANENIELIVKSWNDKLQQGQSIRLNKIGELTLNSDQKIIFKPYNSINFLKESFGLQAIPIEAVNRRRIVLQTDLLQDLSPEKKLERISGNSNKKNRKIVFYVVTAYLPILVALWALFLLKEPFTGQESGFNIFKKSEVIEKFDTKTIEDIKTNEVIAEIETTEEIVNEVAEEAIIPEVVLGPLYYIIGGSFKDSQNAESFQDVLINKNYPRSEVLEGNNGYIRVSYDRFEVSNEALKYLQTINQNENSAAWILKQ
ncbi:MAG: HU-CCDC81 and SPOR domain-containing protein [Bacteroidetes bacterium]|nr:HU-CCDC81 and SPOR domain-containing protein [Bacteroidota bacterium]